MTQTKIPLQQGVIAEPNEILELHRYRKSRRLERTFPKPFASQGYKSLFATTPYRFLRSQWVWAIGPQAVELLDRAWAEHNLSLSEARPAKLKACLLTAFLKASQSTTTSEAKEKLKQSLRAFERNFFPLISTQGINEECRFILLAQLQKGVADGLFFQLQSQDGKNPSEKLGQTPEVALTRLQLEQAYRNLNWVEAWLKLSDLGSFPLKDLTRIYEGLTRESDDSPYRLELLKALVVHPDLAKKKRQSFALDAWSAVVPGGEVGDFEIATLGLFSPKKAVWSKALFRLYEGAPVPSRWKQDYQSLSGINATYRRKCRTLFDILRHCKERAKHGLREDGERHRKQALSVLPNIREFCAQLGIETSTLHITPELSAVNDAEERFLKAREFYRRASGLANLEEVHRRNDLLTRARDYADWQCYRTGHLSKLLFSPEKAKHALRDLCRETGDPYLRMLLDCLSLGGWCPQLESEADRFGLSYSDIVSASHALVKEDFSRHNVHHLCLQDGLSPLTACGRQQSLLCLKLQRLWCCFLK